MHVPFLVVKQYTLKLSENMKQDVTSDPNENVVQYHISNPGHETWIVNDFGKVRQTMLDTRLYKHNICKCQLFI